MADGKVIWEVELDDRNVIVGIKNITDTIKNESKNWDKESKKNLDNMDKNATSTAKTMESAFTGACIAISQELIKLGVHFVQEFAKWVAASIDVASNLEEVQNVVDVTFGDSGAQKIDAWAKKAGSQFGLTELQAKKFTATLGAMMKSSGLTGDEIVKMSTDLAGLSADMASFYNLDFDTAFQKIRAGISGETEPLKQLGINMSVANLDEFLAESGSEFKFSDLSQAEQTVTRYQYLLKATADAQGDFARTAGDSYANMTRQIETQTEKAQETIGKKLLPYAKQLQDEWLSILKWINGDTSVTITGSKSQLEEWLANETEAAGKARDELDALADEWAWIIEMDRESYDPGFYDSYGDFILQSMRERRLFSGGGLMTERLDTAIPLLEEAFGKVTESEQKIAELQAQLDQLAAEEPDTFEAGAEAVSELTAGLQSQEAALQAEVNTINGILSGIGATPGVGVDIPIDGSHALGLDYVPFNGYLAQLHEGEGILTAEENRVWQAFRNGQRGINYDELGGVMRDNIKPGGNVYLDGRVVGAVISDQQGRAYRQMQRSGWQA